MKKQAQRSNPDTLEGRTSLGISFEMFMHSLGNIIFWGGALKESARESNMGNTNKNKSGYDDNALFFENPLKYLVNRLFGGV